MNCAKCGNSPPAESQFCNVCGAAQIAEEAPAASIERIDTPKRSYHLIALVVVVATLLAIFSAIFAPSSVWQKPSTITATHRAPKPSADEVFAGLVEASKGIFTGYRISGTLAIIEVDPATWSLLSRLDRRRVGDGFAANIPLTSLGLNGLEYRVENTVVGRVRLGFTGQYFELVE